MSNVPRAVCFKVLVFLQTKHTQTRVQQKLFKKACCDVNTRNVKNRSDSRIVQNDLVELLGVLTDVTM